MRFFVQEKTSSLHRIWIDEMGRSFADFPVKQLNYSVDIAVRPTNAPIPKELYFNGIPYAQAVQQIRDNTFPWLPHKVEPN